MTQKVVVVREDSTLEEIAKTMLEHRIACVPVVNESGAIVGIVTESDFTAKETRKLFQSKSAEQAARIRHALIIVRRISHRTAS